MIIHLLYARAIYIYTDYVNNVNKVQRIAKCMISGYKTIYEINKKSNDI